MIFCFFLENVPFFVTSIELLLLHDLSLNNSYLSVLLFMSCAQFPERVWEIFRDPLRMAASTQAALAWIKEEEIKWAMAENNGKPKVFVEVIDGVPYERPIVANGGFFKLLMRVQGEEDVPLVFSFRDLYLLGFLQSNVWWLFSDADLEGSGHLNHTGVWRHLKFDGGYMLIIGWAACR